MVIRDIAEVDFERISAIYNHYIRETVVTFEEAELTATEIARRVSQVLADGFDWLVAEHENKLLGYACSSTWKARAAYRQTAEVSVYLDHECTGCGTGTTLYGELFNRLRLKGFHLAIGGIALPNPASVGLHEKFGMKKVAHFSEVGYKFNQWLDVGYWSTRLTETR